MLRSGEGCSDPGKDAQIQGGMIRSIQGGMLKSREGCSDPGRDALIRGGML
jgi:hypothetical protein